MSHDELVAGWERAWAGRDPEAFGPLCAPDLHYEDPLTDPPLRGAAAVGSHAARVWSAFPDTVFERTGARLSDGRYVVTPWRLTGTQRGPFAGVPATGRSLTLHGVFYCQVEHGRLLRVRAFFDVYGAAVALGVLPGRRTLSERALLALRGFGLRARS